MIEGITLNHGESELAFAVIKQAWDDASLPTDGYDSTRSRCFLCGYPKPWRNSLIFWCSLCNLNAEYLMRVSRQKWKPFLLKKGEKCNNK